MIDSSVNCCVSHRRIFSHIPVSVSQRHADFFLVKPTFQIRLCCLLISTPVLPLIYAVLIPSLTLFFCTVFYHIQKAAFFQYFSSVFLFRPLFSFHFAVHYNSLPSGMPFRITWPEGHQRFLIPDFSDRVVRITKNQKRSLQICRSVKDLQRLLCILCIRKRPRYNANTTMISEIIPVKTNLRAIRIFKWLLRLKCHSKHVRIDHTI